MKTPNKILIACSFILPLLFGGWGGVGHKIINRNITKCFPSSMGYFSNWTGTLEAHASDADSRKGSRATDTIEYPRHFIDIENYSGWVANGWLPRSIDSARAIYGAPLVISEGTLPWATLKVVDSLTTLFKAKNYTQATLLAADLGHYVGDGHQPLHITANYDGAQTNQSGVHGRYETTMVGADSALIKQNMVVIPASYISDRVSFVFNYINDNHKYVDSVLIADKAGTLWASTGTFTTHLFEQASYKTASLIYTAWVDAGSPDITTAVDGEQNKIVDKKMTLSTFPNPFNPDVTIEFSVPENIAASNVNTNVSVYSPLGELVSTLADAPAVAGVNRLHFNGSHVSSGIYYVVLKSGAQSLTKKIVLMK